VATTRAVATAMRVICQPGMPPAVITWTGAVGGVAGTGPAAPPGSGIRMVAADAAGTAAQASRPRPRRLGPQLVWRSRVAVCRRVRR
jgi:hypothetical protein